jgi:hypothetical protein
MTYGPLPARTWQASSARVTSRRWCSASMARLSAYTFTSGTRQRDPVGRERLFRSGARPDPATVMSFVDQHRARFGVEPILRVLEVPTSTFYGWVGQQCDPWPTPTPGRLAASQDPRGPHPFWRDLRGAQSPRAAAPRRHPGQPQAGGAGDGRSRSAGAFLRKRWRCSTRQDPKATPAPDLVDRNFKADALNRLWVADLSRIGTGRGRRGWPASGMPSPGGSSAGGPATGPIPSWCWARWSTPSGAAVWMRTLPSAGSSSQ